MKLEWNAFLSLYMFTVQRDEKLLHFGETDIYKIKVWDSKICVKKLLFLHQENTEM